MTCGSWHETNHVWLSHWYGMYHVLEGFLCKTNQPIYASCIIPQADAYRHSNKNKYIDTTVKNIKKLQHIVTPHYTLYPTGKAKVVSAILSFIFFFFCFVLGTHRVLTEWDGTEWTTAIYTSFSHCQMQ